jgi:hypothetical protein
VSVESTEIPKFYLPTSATSGTYAPRLYGAADIRFGESKRRLDARRHLAFLVPLDANTKTIDWDAATATAITASQLLKDPPIEAEHQPLSPAATQVKIFTRWAKHFDRWLARTQRIELTTKQDPPEVVTVGPKRGGVKVQLLAIVWELT